MEEHGKISCEEILRKLHSIEYENETLNLENTKLKVLCVCVVTPSIPALRELSFSSHGHFASI